MKSYSIFGIPYLKMPTKELIHISQPSFLLVFFYRPYAKIYLVHIDVKRLEYLQIFGFGSDHVELFEITSPPSRGTFAERFKM